jgi:RNA polymerase sigma-70 factor, ECF subfamily
MHGNQQAGRNRVGSTITDEELLMEYRESGDRELFAQLVRRYQTDLYNYLLRYLGDAHLAEDAFQNTFLQLHLKCQQFEPGRRLRPWLYTIATNQAIDAQRRNRRHRHVSLDAPTAGGGDDESSTGKLLNLLQSDDAGPYEGATQQEHRAWLQDALETLPEHLRLVIHLVYYQGLKYREAADSLEIPVGTVKSRMHAAVLKLNESWLCSHEGTE